MAFIPETCFFHSAFVFCVNIDNMFYAGMGEGARRRLQNLAANFEQKINNINSNNNAAAGGTPHRSGSVLQEAGGAAAERRGLLDGDGDDDEDMIEFETRKKQE